MAERLGIQPRDVLVSINNQPVRDVLDYRYLTSDRHFTVRVRRDGRVQELTVRASSDEPFGLEFEEELFDGLRTCENNCIFCFYEQMPKGLRPSLYVKDDDFRLSFAHGNYITMTNVTDDDLDRICSQRMSPLYVSVHATEPELRARLLGNGRAGCIMDQLARLADARIAVHAQVVLCPGINDGCHLDRTIRDLASLHPCVASIAIVPVGLTRYRAGLPRLRPVDGASATQVIRSCKHWQREFKQCLGTRLVFPSDEFYHLSGTSLPSDEAYEGYPQFEDGVGLSRLFLEELRLLCRRRMRKPFEQARYILVTGVLAAPLIERLASFLNGLDGIRAEGCIIKNKFFGESVTVAGLLTGEDIADALRNTSREQRALIPAAALNENRFLDGMTLCDLQRAVPAVVTVVQPSPRAVAEQVLTAH